jgi:hypothetical protein
MTQKPTRKQMRRTWKAVMKFADDQPLTDREWEALSCLTMIDRSHRVFGPGNVRWATAAEMLDNLAFYKSLGPTRH